MGFLNLSYYQSIRTGSYMFPQYNKQLDFAPLSFSCLIPRPIICFHSMTKNITLLHSVSVFQSQVLLHVVTIHTAHRLFSPFLSHLLHSDSYLSRLWLIPPTPTPLWLISLTLTPLWLISRLLHYDWFHAYSTMTHSPLSVLLLYIQLDTHL